MFRLLLVALLGLGCGSKTNPQDDEHDEDVQPTDDDDDDIPSACAGRSAFIQVQDASTLWPLVEVSERCLIFGLDTAGNSLYVIDTETDAVRHTIAIGNQPTDMTLSVDGAWLFVAVFGDQEIAVVNTLSGEVASRHATHEAPYRVARGIDRRVFYVGQSGFSPLQELNIVSGTESTKTVDSYFEADLEASLDGKILYIGEANLASARLLRFDTTAAGFPQLDSYQFSGGFGEPLPARRLTLVPAANRLFFADRAFSANDLQHIRGFVGSPVLNTTLTGSLLATPEAVYDGATFLAAVGRFYPGGGALFSEDGAWFYEFQSEGNLLHRRAITNLLGNYPLGEASLAPGSLTHRNFVSFMHDPSAERHVLYGLDAQRNQLVYIDSTNLLPSRAEIIGSQPTDLAITTDGNTLMVATFGATELAIVDLSNRDKALSGTVIVPHNPFVLATSSRNQVVYVEQDQATAMVLMDGASKSILDTIQGSVYQPAIAFDPSGRYLYAGDSFHEESYLRRYDLDENTFLEISQSTENFAYPVRRVLYHSGYLFYARHKLDAVTLAVQPGEFPEDIIALSPNGTYAISRKHIYHTENLSESDVFITVDALPTDSDLVAFSADGSQLFQFRNASGATSGALFVKAMPND